MKNKQDEGSLSSSNGFYVNFLLLDFDVSDIDVLCVCASDTTAFETK